VENGRAIAGSQDESPATHCGRAELRYAASVMLLIAAATAAAGDAQQRDSPPILPIHAATQSVAEFVTWLSSAFDRDGKYHHQALPGPAGLPRSERAGWPWIERPDGVEVPVIHHAMTRAFHPAAVFHKRVFPVATRDGRLVMLPPGRSAVRVRGGGRVRRRLAAVTSDDRSGRRTRVGLPV